MTQEDDQGWETRYDPLALEAVHVRPLFGPVHTFIEDPECIDDPWSIGHRLVCWCRPDLEIYAGGVMVIHKVMH